MLARTNIVRVIVVLVATWAMPGVAVAQKAAVPKPQDALDAYWVHPQSGRESPPLSSS
jgi:hypothetical protein